MVILLLWSIYYNTCIIEWSDDVTNIQQLKYIRDLAMEYSLFLTPYQLSSYSYTVKLLRESLTAISPSSSYKYMR